MIDNEKTSIASLSNKKFSDEKLPTIQKKGFYIPQGNMTNKLVKAETHDLSYGLINMVGEYEFRYADLIVKVKKQIDGKTKKLGTTAKILIDYLAMRATDSNFANSLISFDLYSYMLSRGLKDEKSARQQLWNDMQAINSIELTFYDKEKNKNKKKNKEKNNNY